jgi:hypothetical protein
VRADGSERVAVRRRAPAARWPAEGCARFLEPWRTSRGYPNGLGWGGAAWPREHLAVGHGGSAWPCSGLTGPRLAVASTLEHLGVQGKRDRERGKTEECGAVLATVALNHGGAPVTFEMGGRDNAAHLGLD